MTWSSISMSPEELWTSDVVEHEVVSYGTMLLEETIGAVRLELFLWTSVIHDGWRRRPACSPCFFFHLDWCRRSIVNGRHGIKVGLLFRVRTRPNPSSLDSRSSDLMSQKRLAAKHKRMIVRSLVSSFCNSLKAIEIELSLKTGKLGLMKVARHDVLQKDFVIVYAKSSTMWLPWHYIIKAVFFNMIEYGM